MQHIAIITQYSTISVWPPTCLPLSASLYMLLSPGNGKVSSPAVSTDTIYTGTEMPVDFSLVLALFYDHA